MPGAKAIVLPDLAARFYLRRTLAAPGLAEGPAEVVQDSFAISTDAGGKRFIVVATQGKGEEAGLRAALALGADHIAFVGSRRKLATVSERLARDGLPADDLARVRAPAELNIHAIAPEEIARSILAEINLLRRAGGRETPVDV